MLGRHPAMYYLAIAGGAVPLIQGAEQAAWLDRLETEHDNFRAALAWSLGELKIENVELRKPAGRTEEQFPILNPSTTVRARSPFSLSPQEIGLRLAAALGEFWWP